MKNSGLYYNPSPFGKHRRRSMRHGDTASASARSCLICDARRAALFGRSTSALRVLGVLSYTVRLLARAFLMRPAFK